jgi:hypothetical protein
MVAVYFTREGIGRERERVRVESVDGNEHSISPTTSHTNNFHFFFIFFILFSLFS